MTEMVYTPQAGDPQMTVVNGTMFTAGTPVDVPQEWLVAKLSRNPWFAKYEAPVVPDTVAVQAEITKLKAELAQDEALLSK